jgi:hypothetical protein
MPVAEMRACGLGCSDGSGYVGIEQVKNVMKNDKRVDKKSAPPPEFVKRGTQWYRRDHEGSLLPVNRETQERFEREGEAETIWALTGVDIYGSR